MRECATVRKEAFEAFNERMGLTVHRAWLEPAAKGPLCVVVCEGPGERSFLQKLAASKQPFDRWFRERVSEYHGIDLSKPEMAPRVELLLDWHAPTYAEVGT